MRPRKAEREKRERSRQFRSLKGDVIEMTAISTLRVFKFCGRDGARVEDASAGISGIEHVTVTDISPQLEHIQPEARPFIASSSVTPNFDVEDGEIVDLPPTASMLCRASRSELLVAPKEYKISTPKSSVSLSLDRNSPHCMTAEDLELAKDIVLDLLGWGVEPEYLVECGVSAGTIRRIFTDLRLRLPRNLAAL
ncbi:hypothetical protein B0H11DRAFT_1184412 [Mycena galericulata]|nr:hypothetical protein B0H11DRAFT_1184412 [Mycena galericulata]